MWTTFRSGILSGLCIAIGGIVFLKVGGLAGAVLFSFGLTTVIYYGFKLYTGTAGFVKTGDDWLKLPMVLLGNLVGCWLVSEAVRIAIPDLVPTAQTLVQGRLEKGWSACFLLAIGCGYIMTAAVKHGRNGKMLLVLLGVPVFIMSGFTHSIADAFYFSLAQTGGLDLVGLYVGEVIGNFIGCNLNRALLYDKEV